MKLYTDGTTIVSARSVDRIAGIIGVDPSTVRPETAFSAPEAILTKLLGPEGFLALERLVEAKIAGRQREAQAPWREIGEVETVFLTDANGKRSASRPSEITSREAVIADRLDGHWRSR